MGAKQRREAGMNDNDDALKRVSDLFKPERKSKMNAWVWVAIMIGSLVLVGSLEIPA